MSTQSILSRVACVTATLLPSGQVLAAGGRCYREILTTCLPGDFADGLYSAELYNPATGRWTPTGSMHTGRSLQSATLLRDGTVLRAQADRDRGRGRVPAEQQFAVCRAGVRGGIVAVDPQRRRRAR